MEYKVRHRGPRGEQVYVSQEQKGSGSRENAVTESQLARVSRWAQVKGPRQKKRPGIF